MFERYTEPARRALFFARLETCELGGTAIETEHLLLGLLRSGNGVTDDLFFRSGLDLDSVRNEIRRRATDRQPVSTSVEIPFSEGTKQILHAAFAEADDLGHYYIGTGHLMLAILRQTDTVAGQMLVAKGIDRGTLRREVARVTNT